MARVALKALLMTALVLMSASAAFAANTTVLKCRKTHNVEIKIKSGKAVIDPAKNVLLLRSGECVHWYVASSGKKKYRIDHVRVLRKPRDQRATRHASQNGVERVRFVAQTTTTTRTPTNVPATDCCDLCTCDLSSCDRLGSTCPGLFEAEVQLLDSISNQPMMIEVPTIVVNCTQPCRPKMRDLVDRYKHDVQTCAPTRGCNPGGLHDDLLAALRSEIGMP